MKKALVVGFGSIGQRHASLLSEAGFKVELVTSQQVPMLACHRSAALALAEATFEIIVVANPASMHLATVAEVWKAGHAGEVIVEKPLSDRPAPTSRMASRVRVGYNLRFLPIVARIRELIAGRRLLSMAAHVGQYLPDWRPAKDYRSCVSAQRGLGGGALRELSHELDLVQHLAGPWRRVVATGGNSATLEVDVEDHFALLLECAACPTVQVSVDFLDRIGQRCLTINAEGRTLHADLIIGTLELGGDMTGVEQHPVVDRNDSYRRQLHDVLVSGALACTWAQAMDVVELVAACEQSSAQELWVQR